jgi:hypothetical protein
MKTTELNFKVRPYIMDAIDSDGYDITCNTDKEKLQFLYNTFISEYWHDYNKKYYKGNIQKCFESWLMGLPSCFNIDFENYKVIELAYKWGSIDEWNSTPRQIENRKDFLCQNWFNFITVKTFQLFKKYKIDMIN